MRAIESGISGVSGLNQGAGTGGVARASKDAALVERGRDLATLSAEAKASAWKGALDQLQATIGRIKAGGAALAQTRRELGDILAPVRAAANGGPIGNVQKFEATGWEVGFDRFRVVDADLAPGESVIVDMVVTQSAQTGTLFLNFAGSAIDLAGEGDDPTARFVLEIAGANGVREVSFASGTSVAAIVDTINSFTDSTAVLASSVGGALRLSSVGYGEGEFVSVRVLDDGGIVGGGISRAHATDSNANDGSTQVSFGDAGGGVSDVGQSVHAIVMGHSFQGHGLRMRSQGAPVDAIMLFRVWQAQRLGPTNAGVVSAPGVSSGPPVVSASPGVDIVG